MTPERRVMSKTEVRPLVLRPLEDGTPVIIVRHYVVPLQYQRIVPGLARHANTVNYRI